MKNVLKIAVDASLKAGTCILNYYKSEYEIKEKGYNNPVTTADHAANDKLKKVLLREFPDYGWFSEETLDSPARLEKEYVWIIDPLDGTKEFIEGVPHFVVSVALVKNKEPVIGVLYNPIKDELFTAEKGKGAFLNGESIHTSSTYTLTNSLLVTGFPYVIDSKWEASFDLFKKFYRRTRGIRRLGAAALDFCFVAMGRFDGFWEFGLKSWDVCAGALILRESGGKVTDWDGSPMPFSGRRVLATNGNIHNEMIKTIGKELLELLLSADRSHIALHSFSEKPVFFLISFFVIL